jgi:hypothetical protein
LTVRQVAPIVEEKLSKARALDALQELLGDDLIGIDVGAIEWSDETSVFVKSLHMLSLLCVSLLSHGFSRVNTDEIRVHP